LFSVTTSCTVCPVSALSRCSLLADVTSKAYAVGLIELARQIADLAEG